MYATTIRSLDSSLIEATLQQVFASRAAWTVSWSMGFYTLGRPMYLLANTPEIYRAEARATNTRLRQQFAAMHDAVLNALQDHLGEAVHHHPRTAVPGFHIFDYADGGSYPGGGGHFDLAFETLPLLPGERPSLSGALDENLSFTVALAVPDCGAGLDQWELTYDQWRGGTPDGWLGDCRHTPYAVGGLVVYSGFRWHRIAAVPKAAPGDFRITFQGHCVRINGRWIAYW